MHKNEMMWLFSLLHSQFKKGVIVVLMLMLIILISMIYPILTQVTIDKGFVEYNIYVIVNCSILTLLLALIDLILNYLQTKVSSQITMSISQSLYMNAFNKLIKINIQYFKRQNISAIINEIDADISIISSIVDSAIFRTFVEALRMIGGIIGLAFISTKLMFLILLYIPIEYGIIHVFSKKNQALSEQNIKLRQKKAYWEQDALLAMEEIRLYGIESHKSNEFQDKVEKILNVNRKTSLNYLKKSLVENFAFESVRVAIFIFGALLMTKNELSLGSIMAFITYTKYTIVPINSVCNIKFFVSKIIPSIKRHMAFINETDEVDEGVLKKDYNFKVIKFNNVNFSFDSNKFGLKNISFEIRRGEKIAIVGDNGAGKSTLIKNLLRFYSPQCGKIEIDGEDVLTYELKNYRNLFGVVGQNISLFDDNIQNNIVLYNEIETEHYMTILNKVGLQKLNMELNDAYIGSNGVKLSGGQRQKIAVCRAIACNRPIIVLDEGTESIDGVSKENIRQILKNDIKEKTLICVTHEILGLEEYDKILYLKEGMIIGFDNHYTLMKNNKTYNNFVVRQGDKRKRGIDND